jgi:hypothetical protein
MPRYPDGNPKSRQGAKKPDLSLVPAAGDIHEALAFMDGAVKYKRPFNWRETPVSARVYVAAARRHIADYFDGEDVDPESAHGAHHLGEARACLNIVLDAMACGTLIDDRPTSAPTGAAIRRYAATGALAPSPGQRSTSPRAERRRRRSRSSRKRR